MGKFCEYCGTPLKDGANFGTGCGHPMARQSQPTQQLGTSQQAQQPQSNQPPQQGQLYGQQQFQTSPQAHRYQQPPQKRWGCGKVALIVFLVLLVVLGVGGYFLYDMAKDKIEEVNSKSEETVEKPAATQKTPSTSKTKLKYEMFFNIAIPIPDFGVTTTSKAVVSTLNRKNHEKNNHHHLIIDYVDIWLFPRLVSF